MKSYAWRINTLRKLCKERNYEVGILGDLQGAKIRIGIFKDKVIQLNIGEIFCIDINLPLDQGDVEKVGTTYKGLANDVGAGDTLLIDDGRIVLSVLGVEDGKIDCEVIMGGRVKQQ